MKQPTTIERPYDPERDRDAARRIWHECGWIDRSEEKAVAAMDLFLDSGPTLVTELNGSAECIVVTAPATLRHLQADLPAAGVMGVCTSRVARRRGLAGRLTARAVARNVADGALISGLGIFDQGYYDKLGYGTGPYEHRVLFDPLRLTVKTRPGVPCRLTRDDWAEIHQCRLRRLRGHGSINFTAPEVSRADMIWTKKGFGLGFRDPASGELTHHFWCNSEDEEDGPYSILWMSYRDHDQFLELMAVIRSLGDQVKLVTMREPQGIQLQDLIDQPLRQRAVSQRSKFEVSVRTLAYWQMRICDLPGCLERTALPGPEVRFNLQLTDPIERYLDPDTTWRGVGGDHVVTLGPVSSAEPGAVASLPTLNASVGAFTRLWLGARPATGLAVTDSLAGPAELLNALDQVLRLPVPRPDWDF